jgi:hypothetical protein
MMMRQLLPTAVAAASAAAASAAAIAATAAATLTACLKVVQMSVGRQKPVPDLTRRTDFFS